MADDAVSVLDAAGVERAHVYGFSLGGMVAQQLALRHPDRVRSVVLGATHPGGPRAVRPSADVLAFFRRRASMTAKEAARASVPFNYGPRCRREHKDRIAEDIRRRLAHPFPEQAYRAQMVAAALHNCYAGSSASRRRRSSSTVVRTAWSRSPTPRSSSSGSPAPSCGSSTTPVICTRPSSPRSTRRSRGSSGGRHEEDLRVADVIRRHASERPEAVALRHGERELSYAELDERSNRLAQALLAQGVGAGTRVAYLDRSSPEVVELLFAASKIGAVLVPLNWRLAVPELAAVLADSEAPVLIAGPAFREVAEHVRPPALIVVLDLLDRDRVLVDAEDARRLTRRRAEPPGELGEVVGGLQPVERVRPVAAEHEVVPLRDQVPERATDVTERDPAVHAPRRLVLQGGVRERLVDLVPVTQAHRHRPTCTAAPGRTS